MPLRNRVTPLGDIVASSSRGTVLGNRGVLHDENQNIVRYSANRRWITCALEFRGRSRRIMTPNRWTELFFLDEATAFAAGHRPCAECRRPAFEHFRSLFDGNARAPDIDAQLASERRNRDHLPPLTFRGAAAALPSGTFFLHGGAPHVMHGNHALLWSIAGYTDEVPRPVGQVDVITPESTVRVLARGYAAALHSSAGQLST